MIFSIKKEELPFSMLMSLYFFFVTLSFWILKPIKKSLFIDYYKVLQGLKLLNLDLAGSQAELIAKVLNMFVAVFAVIVFSVLSRKFMRQQLTAIFSMFFIICYILFIPNLPSVNRLKFSISRAFLDVVMKDKLIYEKFRNELSEKGIFLPEKAFFFQGQEDGLLRISDMERKTVYTFVPHGGRINAYMTSTEKDLVVWLFYLFGDLFITVMIVTFFAFLNDSVTSGCAKRLYGVIGFGGVAGGALGAMSVRTMINFIGNHEWMLILSVIAVIIMLIGNRAGKFVKRVNPDITKEKYTMQFHHEMSRKVSAAFEGAKLVFTSKYLLAIVCIVGLYEMVSTIMDFQFTSCVEHYIKGSTGKHFSMVFTITNFTAMFVQLFLTSLIMSRFGVGIALLILPVAAIAGSAGFMIAPVLLIGSALNTIDNGFSYSINQSAKESLYIPTSKEEKYRAKAFIDMFVQRFAKVLAIGLSLLITTMFTDFGTIRWLSLITVVILAIWIISALYAGRQFESLAKESECGS